MIKKAAAGGCQTAYCNTQSLVEDLVDAQERGALRAFLKRYEKVRVLILDDFGYVPISLEGSRLLFRLLTPFFGRKTIILNTNIKFSQWPDVIPEEGLAATIAGRLMDGAILLKLHGRDRRFDAHRAGQ